MNNKLLLLIKKHTDTVIEQTKTKPQETLEFKMIRSKQTFSFNPPINLVEEGKWLLGVTSFECTNSVFNITDENNSFSITIPSSWRIPNYLEYSVIDELKNLLELKSENDIGLHVGEVRKRGNEIKVGDKEYTLSDFDTSRQEILGELKKANYHDLIDMVNRMQLTYNEIMGVLNIEYIPSKRTGYNLPPGIYEVADIDAILKQILPKDVKVNITIDDIRLKSNLKINQTLIFTKKSFFHTILGFVQSYSGELGDIEGFIELIPGTYKGDKPINITGIDKIHLKADCIK